MADDKELQHLKKRLFELAERSDKQGIYTFTPFLGLAQQQVFYEMEREVSYAGCSMDGGSPMCERKMVRFGSLDRLGYEAEYPILCVRIKPVTPKFAQQLTHRDFLGAVMNLGIERGTVGDVFVQDKEAVVFCQESIASYLTQHLEQVKHTRVECDIVDPDQSLRPPVREEISLSVSSARIDSVVSKLYKLARSDSAALFRAGRVFVNGRLVENNSYALKKNDAVTVRGFGRFCYTGEQGLTRKGKVKIGVEI